jgi:hypothetical protein
LGYLHILAITNNAAKDILIKVFVNIGFNSLDYIHVGRKVPGSYDGYMFNFLRSCQTVLQNGTAFYILTSNT